MWPTQNTRKEKKAFQNVVRQQGRRFLAAALSCFCFVQFTAVGLFFCSFPRVNEDGICSRK